MSIEYKSLKGKIKELLAFHLGVEVTDINDDDSLLHDLHLVPAEMSNFLKSLEDNGLDTSKLDLDELETFEDLVEAVLSAEALE